VGEKGETVDLGALVRAAAEPLRELKCGKADPEFVLERLAEAEVGR